MRLGALLVATALLAGACSRRVEEERLRGPASSSPAPEASATGASSGAAARVEPAGSASTVDPRAPVPASTAREPDAVPPGWVWVTDSREGLEALFPGLPLAGTLPAEPAAGLGTARAIVATTREGRFGVQRIPVERGDPVEAYRISAKTAGQVLRDDAWRTDGRALEVRTGDGGTIHLRLRIAGREIFVASVTGAPPHVRELFFDGLRFDAEPAKASYRHAGGGFSVEAPCRLGLWSEASAAPPIVGMRGLFDGNQLAASVADLSPLVSADAALDGGVARIEQDFRGTMQSMNRSSFRGRSSRRFELSTAEGMRATVRMVVDKGRLLQVAVYAPSGVEPAWADAFVDSLAFDP